MACEPKEWIKARYRSSNIKTGSIHVSVNSETLRYAGIPNGVDLLVRVYPLNKGKVLLKFKEVKE